jgi:hypothetical protein
MRDAATSHRPDPDQRHTPHPCRESNGDVLGEIPIAPAGSGLSATNASSADDNKEMIMM